MSSINKNIKNNINECLFEKPRHMEWGVVMHKHNNDSAIVLLGFSRSKDEGHSLILFFIFLKSKTFKTRTEKRKQKK